MASRSKRILIGCGLGCGALVVLGVSGCVGFSIWIGQRGELLEPERLLGRDTAGYVEWTLRLEDPGTEQFVERLIEITQTDPGEFRSPFPDWANDLLAGRQNRRNAREIRQLLPLVAAWTVRPAEAPGEDLHLVTVSVVQLGNRLVFLDWILGWTLAHNPEFRTVEHRGEKIFELPLDGAHDTEGRTIAVFIRRNDLFFASDFDTARKAVERLTDAAETGAREPTELELVFTALPADLPLRGAVSNRNGELFRFWNLLGDAGYQGDWNQEPWNAIRVVTLSGGFAVFAAFAVVAINLTVDWSLLIAVGGGAAGSAIAIFSALSALMKVGGAYTGARQS